MTEPRPLLAQAAACHLPPLSAPSQPQIRKAHSANNTTAPTCQSSSADVSNLRPCQRQIAVALAKCGLPATNMESQKRQGGEKQSSLWCRGAPQNGEKDISLYHRGITFLMAFLNQEVLRVFINTHLQTVGGGGQRKSGQ